MDRKLWLAWSISLMIVGIWGLVLAICNIAGVELPDTLVRVFGVIDLLALPVIAYTSVKLMKK